MGNSTDLKIIPTRGRLSFYSLIWILPFPCQYAYVCARICTHVPTFDLTHMPVHGADAQSACIWAHVPHMDRRLTKPLIWHSPWKTILKRREQHKSMHSSFHELRKMEFKAKPLLSAALYCSFNVSNVTMSQQLSRWMMGNTNWIPVFSWCGFDILTALVVPKASPASK